MLKIRNNNVEDKKKWCWRKEIMMLKTRNNYVEDKT